MTKNRPDRRTCEFTLSADEYDGDGPCLVGAKSLREDADWTCPRPKHHDDRCLFHLSPEERRELEIDDEAVRDRFLEELRQSHDGVDEALRRKQFVGATFGDLDLRNVDIDSEDNHPIDLRHAEIRGELTLRRGELYDPIYFAGAVFHGPVTFKFAVFGDNTAFEYAHFADRVDFGQATFQSGIDFLKTEFSKSVSFEEATFEREQTFFIDTKFNADYEKDAIVNFEKVTFERDAYFSGSAFRARTSFEKARFKEEAVFKMLSDEEVSQYNQAAFHDEQNLERRKTTFTRYSNFERCTFHADAYFNDILFESDASFEESTFRNRANFKQVTFDESADFSKADFESNASFYDARFEESATFWDAVFGRKVFVDDATFGSRAKFKDVVFEGKVTFNDASFGQTATFEAAIFERTATFAETSFERPPTFETTTFRRTVNFTEYDVTTGGTVNLREATIASGTIQRPPEGVVFDVSDGTLGDVAISSRRNSAERVNSCGGEGSVFRQFECVNTSFDGFDFAEYRDELELADWNLHSTVGDSDPRASDLEATYLKAKNGANAVGDSTAASKFFQKEMRYRGKAHRERDSWLNYVRNRLLGLTSSYGESPWKTVAASLVVVAAFTVVYIVTSILDDSEIPSRGDPNAAESATAFDSTGVRSRRQYSGPPRPTRRSGRRPSTPSS
ncbi:pentapeptide repeat-containing protein [Halorussus caseinilyticus]|uniref:Pentapeptide repeat-containing protein n=1 Tax=Halorussus caseinilyticus TaxID=3034025 RepID=A0ABD5WGR4_9EURY